MAGLGSMAVVNGLVTNPRGLNFHATSTFRHIMKNILSFRHHVFNGVHTPLAEASDGNKDTTHVLRRRRASRIYADFLFTELKVTEAVERAGLRRGRIGGSSLDGQSLNNVEPGLYL